MNVRALIRREQEHAPGCSPAMIAAGVLDAIPDGELRPALATALPYLVRDEIRKIRHHALGAADRSSYARPESPVAVPAGATGEQRRAAARKASDAAQAKLARTQAFLATGVSVNGAWKKLGDCGPDDLRAMARENARRAEENATRAEGFERVAADMERRGLRRIRDYEDVALVRQAFGHAA